MPFCPQISRRCFKKGNRKDYRKVPRILQSPIPGTQEDRRPSSDYQPKNLKQSYNKRKIQDGDTACNQESADPRGLGHLNRPERRLFSHSSPSYGQEISPVHTPPGSFPVQGPSVQPDVRAKGILQSHGDSRSDCPSTEHQSTLIPGRLAPQSTILFKMSPIYCNNPASSQQPRIHNQRGEIRTSSDAAIFIPGRGLRPGAGSSPPYTPKISSNRNSLRITEKASSSGSPFHPRSSPRSLPSNVGSQISYDKHGQHTVRIQSEERGRNTLSEAVLHSLGHSHQMSESPHPPSCPTSDGDDERSSGQVEQSEQGHSHRVVYRQQCLPSSYQPTRRARHRSIRHMPQQEASNICQSMPRSPDTGNKRSEHGLEQSSPGVRISFHANSPQSASENQDLISHHHSDSASLANSILVPGSPQSIRSDPIHDSSVHGTPVPSGGSPDHKGSLPDWYMRESGQSSAHGAVKGRVIHSLPLFL